MIDDKVKIKCSKCSQVFRARASRVRPNSELNCTYCNRIIVFQAGSEDPNIRRALLSAKDIRLAIETEAAAARAAIPTTKGH